MTVHPEYYRTRRKILFLGYGTLVLGMAGLLAPLLPAIVLVLIGGSVLALQSTALYQRLAMLRARHPSIAEKVEEWETRLTAFLDLATHTREHRRIDRGDGTTLTVLAEVSKLHAHGVAILLHRAGSTMEGTVQNALAHAMRRRGLTVLRFDARNGLGESGGDLSALTASSFLKDLEAVVAWARGEVWWTGSLILVGHSIGGLVAGRYAELHPQEVRELILFAPTVSGQRYVAALEAHDPAMLAGWRTTGSRTVQHPLSHDARSLDYAFVRDACTYDLIPDAQKLTMPVRIVVGSADTTAPEADCRALRDAIGANATLTVLPNLAHAPTRGTELRLLREAIV